MYSALKTEDHQRAWGMQLIHIKAILCHLMISNWIQSHCISNLSEGKRKQTSTCLRMYFTEHQTMRSSHCQATDSAFNLVSHFAYDVLYNSISLLGKVNHKQEQNKYCYRTQGCQKGEELHKPIMHRHFQTNKNTFSHSLSCI